MGRLGSRERLQRAAGGGSQRPQTLHTHVHTSLETGLPVKALDTAVEHRAESRKPCIPLHFRSGLSSAVMNGQWAFNFPPRVGTGACQL